MLSKLAQVKVGNTQTYRVSNTYGDLLAPRGSCTGIPMGFLEKVA